MDKKLNVLPLIAAIFSPLASAIVDGLAEDKTNFQQFVEMGCTGNIIAGKWVLTAAHCPIKDVVRYDGSIAKAKSKVNHPTFDGTLGDISFLELENIQDVNQINTISVSNVGAGQAITIYGFGGSAPQLNKAVQTSEAVIGDPQWLRTTNISQGKSISGDSGASYLNAAGQIVAVHGGGSSTSTAGMEGYRTETGRQFILDTINGWHYPTNIKVTGTSVITVQSLHVGGTVDSAYTSGDLSIDYASSTCDDGSISEFSTCTYSISTSGGEGQLYLSSNEKIDVNKLSVPDNSDNASGGNASSGGGGGTFGFLTIFFLMFLSLTRSKVCK